MHNAYVHMYMYMRPVCKSTSLITPLLTTPSMSMNNALSGLKCWNAIKSVFSPEFCIASVPGFSFMQYGCGAEKTAKKKKSLVDFDHVGTVTCNGMQFCHTSYLGVK